MRIATPLTELLGIEHPILLAPMGFIAGGRLAAAVSAAGGLGLIGAGYGDPDWIEAEWRAAGNAAVGIGFITWSMAAKPELLDAALVHQPRAVMLSFGAEAPFARKIKDAGAALICQVQTVDAARRVAGLGADVIVAQGTEAGGHGGQRATLPLVPEVVDAVAPIPVVAAGGIADGRGLAAALMLGAAGVMVGTRFYATAESLAHTNAKKRLATETGDHTYRGSVADAARGIDWPEDFTIRTLSNKLTDKWGGREDALRAADPKVRGAYFDAVSRGDFDTAVVIAGEAAGLVADVPPAAAVVEGMIADAIDAIVGGPERYLRLA
jgi:nitronate monooxygenase